MLESEPPGCPHFAKVVILRIAALASFAWSLILEINSDLVTSITSLS